MKINGQQVTGVRLMAPIGLTSPQPRSQRITIPGKSGTLDVSTVLSGGETIYEDRTLSLILEEYAADPESAMQARINAWHGKTLTISPENAPGFYRGSVEIIELRATGHTCRYLLQATVEPWRWNETDTVVTVTAAASPGRDFSLTPTLMSVTPRVSTTASITIAVNGLMIAIPAGTSGLPVQALFLRPGSPVSGKVIGSGTVTFTWRGGRLR